MEGFDQKQYQTVILGALLHDVGKFYQRGLGKGNHEQLGAECFDNYFAEILSDLFARDKVGIIRHAINSHHSYSEFITHADALSAGLDRIELSQDETGDPLRERLQSVFQKVSLGNHVATDNYRYNLEPLSLDRSAVFPFTATISSSLQAEYENLWKKFVAEIATLKTANQGIFINSLYHLLWKYTWCVPSAVYKSEPDISLFDHLKTTAAIAGCLFVKKKSGDIDEKDFLLLGGDFSGIQNFIYKITNAQGVGGVSKRLRGRSFYLLLMQEVIANYLLSELALSIPHLVFCGGGRFEMLLPNTVSVKKAISDISLHINKWLLENYAGELGLVLDWVEADSNSIKDYANLLKDLDDKLSSAKKRKFKEFVRDDQFWHAQHDYKGELRLCRSCNTTVVQKGIKDEICDLCEEHKKIGEKLPKVKYIAFMQKADDLIKETLIRFGEFGVVYLLERNDNISDCYSINDISGSFKLIGNTAPLVIEGFAQETEEETKYAQTGNVLTFETIADMSIGDNRLGILKMDVDYLGLIFAIGLTEKEKSISRITSLSRRMDWFFSGYLNRICDNVFEKWKKDADKAGWKDKAAKIKNIFYTVYSGGDDLLIIGPWSEMPKLAQEIRNEFESYTCNNADIDLSAGIYLCKPKFPISIFARMAGEELKKAKDGGRRRLTFFGDTVKWNKEKEQGECAFDSLFDFGEMMYEAISSENPDNILRRSFVHGLLKKHKQYDEGKDPNFIPAIIYQLERNIKKSAKIHTDEGEEGLKAYLWEKLITDKDNYFKNIKIPASYALLKTRREE